MEMQDAGKSLSGKFQAWAQTLPDDEQQALAQWMEKVNPSEVSGYSSQWWKNEDAWSTVWWDSWNQAWQE